MDDLWSLDTHGDPLGKVQEFIRYVWQAASLDGMLVTLDDGLESHATPRFITDISALEQVNPFRPLMEVNAARYIPVLLAEHSQHRIGALLRPCEMRALVEMAKHTPINFDGLLTISVDCLGTLPADEYKWRLERLGTKLPSGETPDELAQESLKFARQGGITPYRYRPACQVCSSPAARLADINLHVLGLPVRQKMLVSIKDSNTAASIRFDAYTNRIVDQALILQHERILSQMAERHALHMDQVKQSLGSLLPADVDALILQLESCGDCQKCMQVCPICSIDPPMRNAQGHYERSGVIRWLVSCAGCGMCEQSCPKALPTAAIFASIRLLLNESML